jgi:hypothetical protein
MALLDFIKNRNAGKQGPATEKSHEQKPETAKEMYTRQAQGNVSQKGLNDMPPEQRAKVEAVKSTLEKATQHIDRIAHIPPGGPTDNTGNRDALRQNMTGQDKAVPALSPTSAEAGQPATDKSASAPSNEPSAKTPEKSAGRMQQTLPRPRPSWER